MLKSTIYKGGLEVKAVKRLRREGPWVGWKMKEGGQGGGRGKFHRKSQI